jgi:hypothetical protein
MLAIQIHIDIAVFWHHTPYSLVDKCQALPAPASKRPRQVQPQGRRTTYLPNCTHAHTHTHTHCEQQQVSSNSIQNSVRTHQNLLPFGHYCTDPHAHDNCHSFLLRPAPLLPYLWALHCLPRGPTSKPAPSSVSTWIPQVRLGLGLSSLVFGLCVCLFVCYLLRFLLRTDAVLLRDNRQTTTRNTKQQNRQTSDKEQYNLT